MDRSNVGGEIKAEERRSPKQAPEEEQDVVEGPSEGVAHSDQASRISEEGVVERSRREDHHDYYQRSSRRAA